MSDSVTIVLEYEDGETTYEQIHNVTYAEHATRSLDGARGVAVQFSDDETEFFAGRRLAGVYPAGEFEPSSHYFSDLISDR